MEQDVLVGEGGGAAAPVAALAAPPSATPAAAGVEEESLEPAAKRKRVTAPVDGQTDGAADGAAAAAFVPLPERTRAGEETVGELLMRVEAAKRRAGSRRRPAVAQLDGLEDEFDEDEEDVDGTKAADGGSDDEEALNSDDDLSDNAADADTPNLLLALYDKVGKTKIKYKCQFKSGVMNLDGKDYVFQKADAEFSRRY